MKELFLSQEVRLNGMTQANEIRPNNPAMPLTQALEGVEDVDWTLCPDPELPVNGVSVSSTDMEEGWIFIAIPGLVQHGIRFLHSALSSGACAVVTDAEGASRARAEYPSLPIVVVPDPRQASALIAANVYRHPASSLKTAAVTGTNGKTTTTYLLRSILRGGFSDPALCGTVEIRVGDLLINSEKTTSEAPEIERILALARQKDCGAAIVEVSAHALSLNRIDNIVFDVAAFTNLQHDHLDYYGDMESYFTAKKSLFTPVHSKQGVVCVDDEWGQRLARESEVPVTTVAVFSDHEADWKVRKVTFDRGIPAVTFDLETPQSHVRTIRMPMLGEVNVQNAVVALVSAVQMGTDFDAAVQALENAEQVPGRMTSVNPDPGNQPLVIVDFAHTPEGLEWTLKSVRELTRGKLVLVFGTDGDRDATKREPLAAIAAQLADVLWVTDENPRSEDASSIRRQLLSGIRSVRPDLKNVIEVPTCRRDAVREAILAAQAGDIVVISGKGAEWYQEIRGIKHAYNDVPVAQEVLAQDIRARL